MLCEVTSGNANFCSGLCVVIKHNKHDYFLKKGSSYSFVALLCHDRNYAIGNYIFSAWKRGFWVKKNPPVQPKSLILRSNKTHPF